MKKSRPVSRVYSISAIAIGDELAYCIVRAGVCRLYNGEGKRMGRPIVVDDLPFPFISYIAKGTWPLIARGQ